MNLGRVNRHRRLAGWLFERVCVSFELRPQCLEDELSLEDCAQLVQSFPIFGLDSFNRALISFRLVAGMSVVREQFSNQTQQRLVRRQEENFRVK
jgi:hypothetical protein